MQFDLVKALFAIQLKVGEEILELDVLEGDDKDTLTERVCRDHRIGAEYKRAIQGKIIDALLKIIQQQRMHPHLRNKVEKFVQKNTEQSMEESIALRLLSEPANTSITPVVVGSPKKRVTPSKRSNSLSPIGTSIDQHKLSVNQSQSEIKEKSPSPNRHKHGNCSHTNSYNT